MKIEDVKSKIESMNLYIDQQEFNHAATVGQILMNILDENKDLNLLDMENILREINSRVYLLAIPMDFFNGNNGKNFFAVIPNSDIHQENGLWVCMNGKKEAEAEIIKHNLTKEINIENLKKCGFLTVVHQSETVN